MRGGIHSRNCLTTLQRANFISWAAMRRLVSRSRPMEYFAQFGAMFRYPEAELGSLFNDHILIHGICSSLCLIDNRGEAAVRFSAFSSIWEEFIRQHYENNELWARVGQPKPQRLSSACPVFPANFDQRERLPSRAMVSAQGCLFCREDCF